MLYIIIPTHDESKYTKRRMLKHTRNQFPDAEILHIQDNAGHGKGWAVRRGFSRALELSRHEGDLFAFIDGDGDICPEMLNRLINRMNVFHYDIVVGNKIITGILSRRIITFLSRIYIKWMFKLDVQTQTGIKVFRKKALFLVRENGFLFDIVMLVHAKRSGYKIGESSVEATVNKRVSFSSLWKIFLESLRIHKAL